MTVQTVTPSEARQLMQNGSTLVDIREPAEFLRERIPGAISLPLSDILAGKKIAEQPAHHPVIFHCLAGSRTAQHQDALIGAAAPAPVFLLSGGINAWKSDRLPTVEDKKYPLPIMRQVQIVAGIVILTGVVLGYATDKNFFLLSGFVGAGLLFAGVSGWCGMAMLLSRMPWNKVNP
ncbi:rhodanese family protein [Pantoea sp. C2G6]|uniref:rhodanese family protein n=1 Tax=Pantoea sp. C2G6 TaxID=3243084 RepID=UPI003ED890AF